MTQLEIHPFSLGSMDNNTYLLIDQDLKEAAVIDPSFDIQTVIDYADKNQINIIQAWLTHAHYDHFAGIFDLKSHFPQLKIGLHLFDQFLWQQGGLASFWNLNPHINFIPDIDFKLKTILQIGSQQLSVIHTPGHSPGHVVFYYPALASLFCGDLLFYRGIGRTDLPGGSQKDILESIQKRIFTLPPETRLYCGHGETSTIGEEIRLNPYLN